MDVEGNEVTIDVAVVGFALSAGVVNPAKLATYFIFVGVNEPVNVCKIEAKEAVVAVVVVTDEVIGWTVVETDVLVDKDVSSITVFDTVSVVGADVLKLMFVLEVNLGEITEVVSVSVVGLNTWSIEEVIILVDAAVIVVVFSMDGLTDVFEVDRVGIIKLAWLVCVLARVVSDLLGSLFV